MRTNRMLFFAAVLLVSTGTPAFAGWHEFWAEFDLHRRRVQDWPEPFPELDRETVRNPYRMMADNGWRLQNTLNDDLFNRETNDLNSAGKRQVHSILTELPPHRRQIYVFDNQKTAVTEARVAAVAKFIAETVPDQPAATILTTRIPAPVTEGWRMESTYRTNASSQRTPAASGLNSPGSRSTSNASTGTQQGNTGSSPSGSSSK